MVPRVSHVEWLVTDLERAEAFLGALFGWRFEPFGSRYRLYTPPGGTCVGLMQVARATPAGSPLVHVEVEDIDDALARGEALGAPLLTPRTEIPGYGWYAQLGDPDGNMVGLFQAAAPVATGDEDGPG